MSECYEFSTSFSTRWRVVDCKNRIQHQSLNINDHSKGMTNETNHIPFSIDARILKSLKSASGSKFKTKFFLLGKSFTN